MNINVPVSSNHPTSYAIIQNSPAHILTAASPPTAAPLQPGQPALVSGGDVHICGTCGSQYTEIKEFMDHKRQGCQTTEPIATIGETLQPQMAHPPVHQCSPAAHGSMHVGMPVILQAPSGPPQMVRIVLEQNVANPTSQGQSILAQALTGAQIPHVSQSPPQHTQLDHSHVHNTRQQQEIVSTVVETIPTSTETATSEGMIQIANVAGTWQTHSSEGDPLSSAVRVEEERVASNAGVSVSTSEGGASRIDMSANSTMHTEEEDVATFLATQLASQAAPQHNNNNVVSEHLISSVVSEVHGTDPHLQYTSAPTQTPEQTRQQVSSRQRQHHLSVPYPSGTKASPATRKVLKKGGSIEKGQNQTKVTVKTEKEPSEAKNPEGQIFIVDGIEKEKYCVSDKEKYCPFKGCNFVAARNKDRNRHIRTHTGEKPFRCDICGSCFSRSDKMKVHQRIHSNSKPYECGEPNCGYRSIDSGSLRKHMRKHTNERPYSCQMCSYSAKESSQLTVHLRTHTGDTPFHCLAENCTAAFKTSSDLRRHERLHTGSKPYQCAICDYACSIKSNLNVHVKLNHFLGARFGCSKCDFQGNSRKHLKEHEKTHAESAIQCELCDHISTTTTALGQHMLVHSQEKPFLCRYCSFSCKTTGNLRYHVRTKHGSDTASRRKTSNNSGNKGRSSASSNSEIRNNWRPACFRNFKCTECGSGFVRADSWRSHMRLHEKHKLAQAASNKLECAVFRRMDPNPPGETGKQSAEGATTYAAVQPLPTPSITSPLPSQEVQGNSEQGGNNEVSDYNYVITIDSLSTVFTNPVRITEGNGEGETREQQEAVPVITEEMLNDAKSATVQETYTLNAGSDKVATDQGYQLTSTKMDHSHHLYDHSTSEKVAAGQSTFVDQRESQTTVESSEFVAHSAS